MTNRIFAFSKIMKSFCNIKNSITPYIYEIELDRDTVSPGEYFVKEYPDVHITITNKPYRRDTGYVYEIEEPYHLLAFDVIDAGTCLMPLTSENENMEVIQHGKKIEIQEGQVFIVDRYHPDTTENTLIVYDSDLYGGYHLHLIAVYKKINDKLIKR